jgi:hypothetical protein
VGRENRHELADVDEDGDASLGPQDRTRSDYEFLRRRVDDLGEAASDLHDVPLLLAVFEAFAFDRHELAFAERDGKDAADDGGFRHPARQVGRAPDAGGRVRVPRRWAAEEKVREQIDFIGEVELLIGIGVGNFEAQRSPSPLEEVVEACHRIADVGLAILVVIAADVRAADVDEALLDTSGAVRRLEDHVAADRCVGSARQDFHGAVAGFQDPGRNARERHFLRRSQPLAAQQDFHPAVER